MRPALVASCLLLLGFTLPALAAPGDQELVYDLRVGDQSVGTRTVSIRFLDGADAAGVEVIESYTQIDTTLMGTPLHFENRADATSNGLAPVADHHLDGHAHSLSNVLEELLQIDGLGHRGHFGRRPDRNVNQNVRGASRLLF